MNPIQIISIILGIYFIIGAVGLHFANRKKTDPAERREAWKKYVLYLLIVWPLILYFYYAAKMSTSPAPLLWILALLGLYEVIKVSISKLSLLIRSTLIYLVIAYFLVVYIPEAQFLMTLFFLVVVFDGFSQLSGQLVGGRKILPRISPKKTWSGLAGGTIMTILTSLALDASIFSVLLAIWISAIAFTGDLLSSLLKRKAGIKDFSNWIPGHGGILDRFDSFLFVCSCTTFAELFIELLVFS